MSLPPAKVLFLQLCHLPDLIDLQTRVLRLPAIERLLADPSLADHFRHGNTRLSLLQHANYLLHRKTLLLHTKSSTLSGQVLVED
jgi:hypothetical protein